MKEVDLQGIFEDIGTDFALLQCRSNLGKVVGVGNDFGTTNILRNMFKTMRTISDDLMATNELDYFPNGNLRCDTIRLIAECLRFIIAINDMEGK